jgi:hypothetical protein
VLVASGLSWWQNSSLWRLMRQFSVMASSGVRGGGSGGLERSGRSQSPSVACFDEW